MNAILIDELKTVGLQYNEQQMLKRGEPLECLEAVTKRLHRRQSWIMISLVVTMAFPALMMCVSLVLRVSGDAQSATPHSLYLPSAMFSALSLMMLIEVIRQIARCEMLALLAKLENEQPANVSENVAA